jgi:hypothetical protein
MQRIEDVILTPVDWPVHIHSTYYAVSKHKTVQHTLTYCPEVLRVSHQLSCRTEGRQINKLNDGLRNRMIPLLIFILIQIYKLVTLEIYAEPIRTP